MHVGPATVTQTLPLCLLAPLYKSKVKGQVYLMLDNHIFHVLV